jgi:ABC-type Fe3+-siderophore transport system permease subunit
VKRARSLDGRTVIRTAGGLEWRLRDLAAIAGMLLTALLIAAISARAGQTVITFGDVLAFVSGKPLPPDQAYALSSVRLPRILLGFMAGFSVALSGALLQSLSRNPLADPGLLGFSQGSMTAIMLVFAIIPAASKAWVGTAALGGGAAVALLILLLVGTERSSGLALLLMGIAIETMLSAVASILILYTPPETSLALADWMAGSLFQANWQTVTLYALVFVGASMGLLFVGRRLAAYELGHETAISIGEPVGLSRPAILFFAVLLSASAVTAVGPLMFLGVIAPRLAGLLAPAAGVPRLLLSALTGGLLVMGADLLARASTSDMPMPLGLGLTLIGIPLFIIALRFAALRRLRAH